MEVGDDIDDFRISSWNNTLDFLRRSRNCSLVLIRECTTSLGIKGSTFASAMENLVGGSPCIGVCVGGETLYEGGGLVARTPISNCDALPIFQVLLGIAGADCEAGVMGDTESMCIFPTWCAIGSSSRVYDMSSGENGNWVWLPLLASAGCNMFVCNCGLSSALLCSSGW